MPNADEFFKKRLGSKLGDFQKQLEKKPIVLFMLAKKVAGKGTYSKYLQRLSGGNLEFVSVGDMMRDAESMANMLLGRALLHDTLKEEGFDEAKIKKFVEGVKKLDQTTLYPTNKIMALLKILLKEVAEENPGKSLIIDGLPRDEDQVDIAIDLAKEYEKEGMKWFFVEIDCAEEVLEARIKDRRVCPECSTSRNIKLLLTPEIEYEAEEKTFHLICDNSECDHVKMIQKPGDELGLKPIQDRQDKMAKVMEDVREKVSKDNHIMVSNTVKVDDAEGYDSKDFTEEAELSWDADEEKVKVNYIPWVVKDDQGEKAYSRYAEPVVAELVEKILAKLESSATSL